MGLIMLKIEKRTLNILAQLKGDFQRICTLFRKLGGFFLVKRKQCVKKVKILFEYFGIFNRIEIAERT